MRTTVTVEYECHDCAVDDRIRNTSLEQAQWLSFYSERYGRIVDAKTERIDGAALEPPRD